MAVHKKGFATGRKLFETLLREAAKFSSYNFKEHAKRRIAAKYTDTLKPLHTTNSEKPEAQAIIEAAKEDLKVLERMTVITRYYAANRLVVEK